jgi:trans-L-3-hydroxyproline dehydratase
MCGHGVIALVTALVETGAVPAKAPLTLDTPAGVIRAAAHVGPDGKVAKVSFRNVPSFVLQRDLALDVPGLGPSPIFRNLAGVASGVRKDPFQKDLPVLYGGIFTDMPEDPSHHSRNLCVFANAEVDRSPTGTGVAARLAVHHARGEVAVGETITIDSNLGRHSVFEGRVVAEMRFGPHPGIIPEVSGRAFLTGRHEFVLDPDDPLGARSSTGSWPARRLLDLPANTPVGRRNLWRLITGLWMRPSSSPGGRITARTRRASIASRTETG